MMRRVETHLLSLFLMEAVVAMLTAMQVRASQSLDHSYSSRLLNSVILGTTFGSHFSNLSMIFFKWHIPYMKYLSAEISFC